MPELPEVETMVRGIRQTVVESRILQFNACPNSCRPMTLSPPIEEFSENIEQSTIVNVWRKAKRVVIDLDSECHIVFEPRMTGLVLLEDPPSVEHLRFQFQLSNKRQRKSLFIWDRRGLGTLRLYTPDQFEHDLGPNLLGTDALEISVPEFTQKLKATQRPIKVALLDQRLVAGVGNLYASEILHEAAVNPEKISSTLSNQRILRIHTAMNRILNEAIAYEGSTLNDGTYRNALNKDGGYQNKHQVYAREGEMCHSCQRTTITRIVQAQRATFYCRRCQRR
ncbi:Formamidopyrimidine-DNA glycosylase [Thalassoglobus neptunius]|uniref:Formamidopyrimidine-DNA glycosylase n=1 Tax=Thalassoglobus neptunius TaxID=1938619 RepID=A0A5C5WLT6_9PLAN|nr:DNA-formamidopyrimidine glycosylase [Thalassoglobus neptunius]TWT51577.1 Formamidopyrimidine-DNA glycosylase [Thalassoglobus neptunius]